MEEKTLHKAGSSTVTNINLEREEKKEKKRKKEVITTQVF